MKIGPVGAELFHAYRQTDRQTDRQRDRQTDRQTDKTKFIFGFRGFVNAPKTVIRFPSVLSDVLVLRYVH